MVVYFFASSFALEQKTKHRAISHILKYFFGGIADRINIFFRSF